MTRMRATLYVLTVLPGLLLGATAFAQTYPAKSVRVIVPYPPGGGNDIIARAVVDELSRRTAQQFFVDNRPGASTIIGAELAIKAPPDGYTLFVSSQTTLAIVPNLKTKVPYDPLRDFEPVSLLATQPYLVVTHPSLPVHNVAQLAALAKSRPGKIVYASSGIGTGGHLSGELFKMMTRTDMLHVPYKGGAQAVTDVLAGNVSIYFSGIPPAIQHVKAGKLTALGVAQPRPVSSLPNVPPLATGALARLDLTAWFGFFVPKGTPDDIVTLLNTRLRQILDTPEMQQRLVETGVEPASMSAAQFEQFVANERTKYGRFISELAIQTE